MSAGVVELNALFVLVGLGILFAACGWETWLELGRDLGLALVLGVSAVGVATTTALVVGAGLSTSTVLVLVVVIFGVAVGVGVRRHSPHPTRLGPLPGLPRTLGPMLTTAGAIIAIALALDLFVSFRHAPLVAYDAWNFWIPKAKTLYFFGLDAHLLRSIPNSSYPLLVPGLDAIVFRFAHTLDPAALAQQYGFLLLGLVGSVVSLLSPISRRGLVWLFVATMLVVPEVSHRWFQLLADWTLDTFFVVTALMLLRWLVTRERWLLWAVPIPLAAMLVTKREGQVFAAALVLALAVATVRERKTVWPRIAAFTLPAYVVSQLPWRLWWTAHHFASDLTGGGIAQPGSLLRAAKSAVIVVQLVFSYQLWLLAVPIGLLAAAAAVLVRRDALPAVTFYIGVSVLGLAAFIWAIWATPTIPLDVHDRAADPVPREAASLALLSLAFAPRFASMALERYELPILSLHPAEAVARLIRRGHGIVVSASPRVVIAAFLCVQWVLAAALALVVRHNGWIYYQGGDQLWYYSTAWLFGHGASPQPLVGYLWSVLLTPIALLAGPNVANAYPAIILVDVLVLLPVALLALYGIARLLAGRLFAYWVLLLWLVVPFAGIRYTNTGYHQRYTELLLPQGFGLTAMADFPTMVATLVAAYFCARIVFARDRSVLTAVGAGLAAGASIGLKPSNALFLLGPPLALLFARRLSTMGWFLAGLAPSVLLLALWKYRGYGYLPLLHADATVQLAAGAHLVALHVPSYGHFNWQHFTNQLDLLREHFWSARLIEWLVIAGAIGAARRSWASFVFVGGWFFAFALAKGGASDTTIEDGNLLRILLPAAPAFVLLIALVPLVVPGLPERIAATTARPWAIPRRAAWAAFGAAALVTAVVPAVVIAGVTPLHGSAPAAVAVQQPPVPAGIDMGLHVRGNVLTWRPQHAAGGAVFYHVFRTAIDQPLYDCPPPLGAAVQCHLQASDLGTTHVERFVDHTAGRKHWRYVVAVAANWVNDPAFGDVYELSVPAAS